MLRALSCSIPSGRHGIEPLESRIAPATVLALTENNTVLRFDHMTPSVIDAVTPVTGLGAGEMLRGIDFDPFTGVLGGLSVDASGTGRFYRIEPTTGAATLVSTFSADPTDQTQPFTALSGTHFSWDFSMDDPGLARVLGDQGQNLRVDFSTGLVKTDVTLVRPPAHVGDPASRFSGLSEYHSENLPGFLTVDTARGALVSVSGWPDGENRIVRGVSVVGVDASSEVGMDSDALLGNRLISLTDDGVTGLYGISTIQQVSRLGTIGDGATPIRDIALVVNVWTGAGGDANWTTAANWKANLVPGTNSELLFPAGASRLANVNDFPAGTLFNAVRWEADGYVLTGNELSIRHDLLVSGGTVKIEADIALRVPPNEFGFGSSFTVEEASWLEIHGSIHLNGYNLAARGAGTLELIGDVLGESEVGSFTKLILNGEVEASVRLPANSEGSLVSSGKLGTLIADKGTSVFPGGSEAGTLLLSGSLNMHPGSTLYADIRGVGSERKADQLVVNGGVYVEGKLELFAESYNQPNAQFTLIDNRSTSAVGGTFTDLPEGAIVATGTHRYQISYIGGDGNDVVLTQLFEPTVAKNGRSVQFTDVDGDLVTVSVSKGTLEPWRVQLARVGLTDRFEFLQLDLSPLSGKTFNGADVTIRAVPQEEGGVMKGDRFVNVGRLTATGVNLGAVTVDGNLGSILAGNISSTSSTKAKPGVKSLQVQAFGQLDTFTTDLSEFSESLIQGNVAKLSIRKDLAAVSLEVTGNVGNLTIGGSIVGGEETESGRFHAQKVSVLKLGGNIEGGAGERSGTLEVTGELRSLKIEGALVGSEGLNSGSMTVGSLLTGRIDGGIRGGSNDYTGTLTVTAKVQSLSIGEAIEGGDGKFSGSILGEIEQFDVFPGIQTLKVSGGVFAGEGEQSGSVVMVRDIRNVDITGSVSGEIRSQSGLIQKAIIRGDLLGTPERAARVVGYQLGSLSVKGSVIFGEVGSTNGISTISIDGELQDSTVLSGRLYPEERSNIPAIGKVTIGGDMERSRILAGHIPVLASSGAGGVLFGVDPDASIGSVVVRGDFVASDIVAGITSENDSFGDEDDRIIHTGGKWNVLARIASITVLGQVYGTDAEGDSFGIVAQEIGSVKIGKDPARKVAPGELWIAGITEDLVIHEEPRTAER